ncbi:MAG: dTDP-4-dehydrorhamnose 3,5-epimerase [Acidobacteriota bacterium]
MIFHETKLQGVYAISLERLPDDRGFFARSWCSREFQEQGLIPALVQCSVSFSAKRGTLRGLHYQAEPSPESKLVRCTRGAIHEVVVDLRPASATFRQWISLTLSAANREMVFVPHGCAHGFLTLADETELFYQMSEFYRPELARGVRWDDPCFGIVWPEEPVVMSERDRGYPDFRSGEGQEQMSIPQQRS